MIRYKFIIIFVFPLCLFAQSNSNIDKDKRIGNTTNDIIRFLIEQKELSSKNGKFSTYYSKVYINKEFEFANSCNKALIVKFGSTADHAQEYWGVISAIKTNYTVYIIKENESVQSLSANLHSCDTARSKAILQYIQCVKRESPWVDLSTE